ncbi:hypothetical protein EOL73_02125 [Candidatus Saccharibacteria bacterium]|nr:hypothetical protein [Candidatus Saccharibacteria bacterium]NCU40534.1 hypothetical protein [Candidatus Saccharibacteria bacterium]
MSDIKKHQDINMAAKTISDWRSMIIVHAIYEHGPVRYKDLDDMLELSPTILSGKLSQLTDIGVIRRIQAYGAKEVTYKVLPIAENMVKAYHLLESVEPRLRK